MLFPVRKSSRVESRSRGVVSGGDMAAEIFSLRRVILFVASRKASGVPGVPAYVDFPPRRELIPEAERPRDTFRYCRKVQF